MTDHTPRVRILASSALAQRLNRRAFLGSAALLGGSAFLAACGGGGSGSGSGSGQASGGGELEDSLNIYTWAEYDDPDVIKEFTSSTGPKVQIDSFNSNEEMIAKLVSAKGTSGYDIVVPTDGFVPQMVENDLLLELDHSAIPNLSNLDAAFADRPHDKGNKYTVCKDWGTTGFVYDKTKITRELKNWTDFLDAAQKEASGQTSVLDAPGDLTGMYFWANDIDWNTTEEKHLDAAEEYIVGTLAPHVKAFDSYPSTAMVQGSYVLAQGWNGDIRQGILQSDDPSKWQWVLGAPKTELWMDNWAIPVGAPHPNAAHEFINYILDPAVSLKELTYIGYHTGVKDIQPAAEEAGIELVDMVFFTPEQLATMVGGQVNEAQQRVVDIWNKAKAAAGG